MGFFDKLFGQKNNQNEKGTLPDNRKLIYLLDKYGENRDEYENYSAVMDELLNGESWLLLSSQNENKVINQWNKIEAGSTLNLTCIFDVDGLKILGAFTDEHSLLEYMKRETSYTAMKTQDVLSFCETNGIDRIVINGGQKNAWFTEKSKQNVQIETVEKKTIVEIGTLDIPIDKIIVEKLRQMFSKVDSVLEVYQYGQTKDNEFNLVLGIKLSIYNDNSKTASINAVQRALDDSTFNQPLDIFFIETDNWYNSIKNIQNALLYRR